MKKDENSLLATMFSGRHRLVAEEDGSYFIDRDPHCFRMVLNYLRDSRVSEQLPLSSFSCLLGVIDSTGCAAR